MVVFGAAAAAIVSAHGLRLLVHHGYGADTRRPGNVPTVSGTARARNNKAKPTTPASARKPELNPAA